MPLPDQSQPLQSQPLKLALFDLDHTLLPIDSDVSWANELARLGLVDPQWHQRRNDEFYEDYKAGVLDIDAFLAFQLGPLAEHPRQQLEAWREDFLQRVIFPQIHESALALVRRHQDEGCLCAVVTATNDFITRPIAKVFGIDQLIATEVETNTNGEFTGRHKGLPSFREGKVTRVGQWLALQGLGLEDFKASWFYSDSMNDLPLLAQVSHPVATNPDDRLRAHALAQGWSVLELFKSQEA
jgi:HAD superfamily hydrolase (TIGR01490 family)